jgi:putative endonuclease
MIPTLSLPGLSRQSRLGMLERMRQYYVYFLASRPGGTIYVGVTNNLIRRVYEHRTKAVPGFTKTYNVDKLVHYEIYSSIQDALQREKNIKHWPRTWKTNLILQNNPSWRDLYEEFTAAGDVS